MSLAVPVQTITLAAAERAVAAALAHARAQGWRGAVADPSGGLVAFGRMDGTPLPVADIAIDKAYTAATLRRSTRAFGERMAGSPTLSLGLANRARVLAWEGGLPIEVDGTVVGGIGVSGAAGPEDEACAAAAIAALHTVVSE
ncbi:MAG TPA: heme-binding protein [Bauldia sp.]|nr:heme-binding protein [Bauldia sp.]